MYYTKKLRSKKQDNETEKKKKVMNIHEKKITFKCIKAVLRNVFTESANNFGCFLQVNCLMILLQLDVLLTFRMLT